MRAMKTRVARHPAIAALPLCLLLLIALIAFLSFTSCNKQHSLAKQPSPTKPKPSAALLAEDISKLGFIPGKPVTLPPDFKAERHEDKSSQLRIYNFKNGFCSEDTKDGDTLKTLAILAPISSEEEKAAEKEDNGWSESSILIGPKIPISQRSTISFVTWDNKDVFSLSREEITRTYGQPSLKSNESSQFSGLFSNLEYVFIIGEDSYELVRFLFEQQANSREALWGISMMSFKPTEEHPLSQYKVYPWPGLYPEPGK